MYYFCRLYITFYGYILHLSLPYCDFAKIKDVPAIPHFCGLKDTIPAKTNWELQHFGNASPSLGNR